MSQPPADIELELKSVELDLKRKELAERGYSSSWKAISVSIAIGAVAMVGNLVVDIVNARFDRTLQRERSEADRSLERQRFESNLVLSAIETGDAEAATRNLLFLTRTGLLPDPSGRIAALAAIPTEGPVLPSQGETPPAVTIGISPSNVPLLGTASLSWESTNATSCVASDDWSGLKKVKGEEAVAGLVASKKYTIACVGPGGTAKAFTFVTVDSTPSSRIP